MKERLRVLVVDDERPMVRTFCDILRAKGHEALAAYGGAEAVAKAKSTALDFVLMDIHMPDMDGVQALAQIRKVAPALPVALMSAVLNAGQVSEARRQGVHAVLSKPVDLQQVLAFLDEVRQERSILVVDDDPAFCRTLREILQGRGYGVEVETDPAAVLGRLEPGARQVVLLDLQQGDACGLDLLREIRGRFPETPVVLVSDCPEGMTDVAVRGLQRGACACLYKPLGQEELLAIIEEINGGERLPPSGG